MAYIELEPKKGKIGKSGTYNLHPLYNLDNMDDSPRDNLSEPPKLVIEPPKLVIEQPKLVIKPEPDERYCCLCLYDPVKPDPRCCGICYYCGEKCIYCEDKDKSCYKCCSRDIDDSWCFKHPREYFKSGAFITDGPDGKESWFCTCVCGIITAKWILTSPWLLCSILNCNINHVCKTDYLYLF